MTIAWDSYLPEVLPEVPNCPDQVAINAIRSAAIEFCQKTRVWRTSFGPLSLVANTSSYPVAVPANTELVTVIQAAVLSNGSWSDIYGPYSEETMDMDIATWREDTTASLPNRYLNDVNNIKVYPIPTQNYASSLKGIMSLRPTRASTGGDDILYNDWLDAIASGAKSKLQANLTATWRNPELSAHHKNIFDSGKAQAIAKIMKGGRASLTAFYQSFK